jgi:hypothetical protein
MLILDEILKQLVNIRYLGERKNVFRENDRATLFLKCLEFGPLGGPALELEYSTENEKLEMRFEKHSLCWLPYYFRDSKTEIFLYEFVGARQPLHLDVEAGSFLMQRACLLELTLRAHGFDRMDHEQYHPLFAGGVS